ncbi:MAG: hypothetical protein ACOYMG_03645 [Candidatus Methylumidiphilus sp.]
MTTLKILSATTLILLNTALPLSSPADATTRRDGFISVLTSSRRLSPVPNSVIWTGYPQTDVALELHFRAAIRPTTLIVGQNHPNTTKFFVFYSINGSPLGVAGQLPVDLGDAFNNYGDLQDGCYLQAAEYDFNSDGNPELIVAASCDSATLYVNVFMFNAKMAAKDAGRADNWRLIGKFQGQFKMTVHDNIVELPYGTAGLFAEFRLVNNRFVETNDSVTQPAQSIDSNAENQHNPTAPSRKVDCNWLYEVYTARCSGRGVDGLTTNEQNQIGMLRGDTRIKITEFEKLCNAPARTRRLDRLAFERRVCQTTRAEESTPDNNFGLIRNADIGRLRQRARRDIQGYWCGDNEQSLKWVRISAIGHGNDFRIQTSDGQSGAGTMKQSCVDLRPGIVRRTKGLPNPVRVENFCLVPRDDEGPRPLPVEQVVWDEELSSADTDGVGPEYKRCAPQQSQSSTRVTQPDNPLRADGVVSPTPTIAPDVPPASQETTTPVGRLQVALTSLGFYSGPVSGAWDEPTRRAMVAFRAVVPPAIKKRYGNQITAMAEAAARHEFSLLNQ